MSGSCGDSQYDTWPVLSEKTAQATLDKLVRSTSRGSHRCSSHAVHGNASLQRTQAYTGLPCVLIVFVWDSHIIFYEVITQQCSHTTYDNHILRPVCAWTLSVHTSIRTQMCHTWMNRWLQVPYCRQSQYRCMLLSVGRCHCVQWGATLWPQRSSLGAKLCDQAFVRVEAHAE